VKDTIRYLFSDMDGTLIGSDHAVSAENAAAIRTFVSRGGHFSVATGRSPEIALPFLHGIPLNAPAILYNGAAVYDFEAGAFLHKQLLPAETVRLLIGLTLSHYPQACVQAFDEGPIRLLNPNGLTDPYIVEEGQPFLQAVHHGDERYLKLLFFGEPARLQKVAAAFDLLADDTFRYTFSAPFYLEVLPAGVSKGNALRWICSHLGCRPQQTAAVGDFDNDAEMLRYAGLGAAPANASPAAAAAADVHLGTNDEHAVAQLIRTYLLQD
jgi:Cof subfamily protein (haloacid dehalogenase superfamily)